MSRFCSGVARDRDYADSSLRVVLAELVEPSVSAGKLPVVSLFLIFVVLPLLTLSE